jgi:hypothetical protein
VSGKPTRRLSEFLLYLEGVVIKFLRNILFIETVLAVTAIG